MKRILWFLLAMHCLAWAAKAQETPAEKLWKACRMGDTATVRQLLDSGVSVNTNFGAGITPLAAASARGQVEVVQLLLDRGANPNARDDAFRITPLATAFFFGQPKVVPLLLPKTTEDLDLVLRFAAMQGAAPMVEAALKGKIEPYDIAVAWTVAAAGEKKEVLAVLEKAGAKAPAKVEPAEFARYAGTYQDSSKLELTLDLREGKLLATGGSGFSEFFEQEVMAAGPGLLFPKGNPGMLFQFEGAGEKFDRATMMIAGAKFVLKRVQGGSK